MAYLVAVVGVLIVLFYYGNQFPLMIRDLLILLGIFLFSIFGKVKYDDWKEKKRIKDKRDSSE